MTVPKQQDLLDVIIADHRDVEAVFDEIEASGDARNWLALVDEVTAELVRHSVADEQYLYPTVRRVLPDGDAIADREIAAHADAEEVMKQLERTDAADPTFADLVRSLVEDVRHHIREEERDLLPRLRSACEEVELREL
ncbi:hemerythrin domain-containing protein, partial [Actinophytocola sp.]|uniref:hemerythrin domain-containing protein n=1 Tax=Actinophytocola sp. TaxID=1872138 RepID=UPI0025C50F32